MDIGEVIARSGLPASTLRFYEQKNLIEPVGRNGLRRNYDADVLDRLALIALGRNAGFTLEEIAAMFTPDGPKIDRTQLASKADQLDRTIRQLIAMRDGLRHASLCPAPSHFECNKFQRLLGVALKSQRRRKR
jgi:DNA-binding transcriptional MerR regulator